MSSGTEEPLRRAGDRQRSAAFLDRVEEYRFLEEHLRLLSVDPGHLLVVGLAGLGGIGKSRFLGEVRSRFAALVDPPTVVSVPLETPTLTALMAVRDAVEVDCHLFDVALATYGAVTEQPLPHARRPLSWWTGAREQGIGGLEPEDLPTTFAIDRFDEFDVDLVLRRRYERSAFAAIDGLRSDPDEMFRLLPVLLGQDVARVLTDPARRRVVFLYDGYEDAEWDGPPGEGWLPRFIRSVGAGIHVVTARHALPGGPEAWGTRVEQRRLGELPEAECRRMIRRELGDHLRREVEDRLVAASGCIPFYLHVSVDVCRAHLRGRGTVEVAALPSSSPSMVDRLLDHLTDSERDLALAVAAVQYFDEWLYRELVRVLGLGHRDFGISAFLEWFFVAEVDQSIFRTHHLLTDFVRRGAEMNEVARTALTAATVHLALRIGNGASAADERLFVLFRALVEAWQQVREPPREVIETLVDIGYGLYDAGHWRELAALPGFDEGDADDAGRLVAQYFGALSARRSEGPVVATNRLLPLEGYRELLGRHEASFAIELAYLQELRGDYAHARRLFGELNDAITTFDGTRRDHIRTRLYFADMLTMDGRLREASRMLVEAYETVGEERAMDWAELVRHRGHAHRFALEFEVALNEYLRALDVTRNVASMRGKLRTNVAETRCWLSPHQGIRDAQEAIELNVRLASGIEVAKAEAALAVALSGTGQIEAARAACDRALTGAQRLGYRAGACFAHQARVVVEVRAGASDAASRSYNDLVRAVDDLSTYHHLCVVPAWFLQDDAQVTRWSRKVDWTGDGNVAGRLTSLGSR